MRIRKNPLSKLLQLKERIQSVFYDDKEQEEFIYDLKELIDEKAEYMLGYFEPATSLEDLEKLRYSKFPAAWAFRATDEILQNHLSSSNITDKKTISKISETIFEAFSEIWDIAYEIERVRLESVAQYLKTQSKFISGHIFIPPFRSLIHKYHRDPIRVLPIWEALLKEANKTDNIQERHWWGVEIECCLAPKQKLKTYHKVYVALPIYAAFEEDSSILPLSKTELPVELVLPPLEKHILFNHVRHWINTLKANPKENQPGYKILGGPSRRCGLHISTVLNRTTAMYLDGFFKAAYDNRTHRSRLLKWCGRTSETIKWAHPEGSGKYVAVNFRKGIDSRYALYEIRIFQTPPIVTYTEFLTVFHKLENLLDNIDTALQENISIPDFLEKYSLEFTP